MGRVTSQPVFASGQKNRGWVGLKNSDPFCHVYKLVLGCVGKIYRKLICMKFNQPSLIFYRSSLADLANKSCNSLDSNFTNKHTLSSLNLDSKFWSWFANTLHIKVLIHLVPKVLEPNGNHETTVEAKDGEINSRNNEQLWEHKVRQASTSLYVTVESTIFSLH